MSYYYATIEQDTDLIHPRDNFDHYSTLYTWHRRYSIGGKDDENYKEPINNLYVWAFDQFNELTNSITLTNYTSYDQTIYFNNEEPNQEQMDFFLNFVQEWLVANVAILPIYMYDHSGITISTEPFSCPLDSGQIGVIYIEKSTCEKAGINFDNAKEYLKEDIEELNNYLTGNVFVISIHQTEEEGFDGDILDYLDEPPKDKEMLDCIGGYYGYSDAKSEAKRMLMSYQKELETETV